MLPKSAFPAVCDYLRTCTNMAFMQSFYKWHASAGVHMICRRESSSACHRQQVQLNSGQVSMLRVHHQLDMTATAAAGTHSTTDCWYCRLTSAGCTATAWLQGQHHHRLTKCLLQAWQAGLHPLQAMAVALEIRESTLQLFRECRRHWGT
jgi:hypothetical protein